MPCLSALASCRQAINHFLLTRCCSSSSASRCTPLQPLQALQLRALAQHDEDGADGQQEAQHAQADANGQGHIGAGVRGLSIQQRQVCLHVACAQPIGPA